MLTQFDFDPQGVADWQAALATSTPSERQAEADLAASGLINFLPVRFLLDQDQVDDIDELNPQLSQQWAEEIAYAIANEIPIELVKPARADSPSPRSTKYIESEGKKGTNPPPSARLGDPGYFLRFTISY